MSNWSDPIEGQGTAHDFMVEPVFEGSYRGKDFVETRDNFGGGTRESSIHRFSTPAGPVDVWGSVDLDAKMKAVPVGTLTQIVFQGTEPTVTKAGEERHVKRYQVRIDKTTIPVPDPANAEDIPF